MSNDTAPEERGVARTLTHRAQWAILATAAIAAAILFYGAPRLAALFSPPPAPAEQPTPKGTFRATDEQWSTFRFATAETRTFRVAASTDGKIATDDDRTTQVYSPFSGRVTAVMATAGQAVRAGQPLFAVQALEFVQTRSDLATAAAQVRVAEAAEARQHALYAVSGAALKDWQQSQADLASARAALASARDRLALQGVSRASIAALEHGGGADQGRAIVAAPITGVVLQRNVGEGQNVASVASGGATAEFVVSDLSRVWLVANLREADVARVRLGQAMEVTTSALAGETFRGRLDFIAPTVDPTTHRVAVRATIDNPGLKLKPEMFAEARLLSPQAEPGVSVPEAAVIFEADTARVWVAGAGHTLSLRQIRVGRVEDGVVEVVSGLKAGEQVVTSGSLFIDRAAQDQ